MRALPGIEIVAADPQLFDVASDFWLAMRHELHMPDADLPTDWKNRAVRYFTRRHAAGELAWFFARAETRLVGSAAGFFSDGYPAEICTQRRVGYVAGVFVDTHWRRRGIARALTETAVDWLQSQGCQIVRLHAADNARPIYEAMGFVATNEMVLKRAGS